MSDSSVVSEWAVPAVPDPAMRRGRSAPVRLLCAFAALAVCAGAAVVAAVPAGAQQTTYTYELFYVSDDSGSPRVAGIEGNTVTVGLRVTPPLPTPTQTEPTTLVPNPPIVYDSTAVFNLSTHDGTAVNPRREDDPRGFHRGDFLGGIFPISGFSADPGTTPTSVFRTLPLLVSLDREIEGDEYFEIRVAPPTGGVDASLFSPARPGADRIRMTIKDATSEPVFKRPFDRHSVYLVAEGDSVTGTVNSTGLRSNLAELFRISSPLADALSYVQLTPRDGSARAGVDYTAPTGGWAKSFSTQNPVEDGEGGFSVYGQRRFSVATIDDSVCQPTRSFTLAFTHVPGTEAAFLTERSTATVYISEPSDTTDAPPAPPIYGVDQVSATSMKVRWGSAICADTYELAYKLVSGSSWTTVASGSLDSRFSHTVTGLTADTAYHVRVRAKNGTVNGAWSSVFTYTPPTAGKLTGLTLDDGTNDLVLIPRSPGIDGFRGARPELGYVVKVAPGTRSVGFTPTFSDANITGVRGRTGPYGSTRYVGQQTVTSSGTRSGDLSIVNGGTWARIDGPAQLNIVVSPGSATYNLWITPDHEWASADNYLARLVMTGSSRQSSPVDEQVGHSIPERRAGDVVTLPAHSSAHGVSDLFGGYSVAASDGMSVVTMDASPGADASAGGDSGDATAQLDGSGGSGSVRIDLSEPFDDEQYGYTATVPNDVTSVTVDASPAHPDATVTVNGNTPQTPVQLEVGANSISVEVTAENGYQRTYVVTITRQPLPPGSIDPADLDVTAKRRRITVAWDAPDSGGAPDGYIVHIRPQGGKQGSGSTKRVDADRASVTFKRLEPGTAYKIWIRAHNSAAKGDRTHTTAATTD